MGTVWPHDNWFLWRGLRAVGLKADAKRVRDGLVRAFEALGKIPECYAVIEGRITDLSGGHPPGRANPLQAWSLAALFDMISVDDTPVSP
jgi:glycogen debranching enzyme